VKTERRTPTEFERAVFCRLLQEDFPGRNEVAAQLADCEVEAYDDEDNYGSCRIIPKETHEPAITMSGIPVEGRGFDADGVPIDYILYVEDGFASDLNVVKADGTAIMVRPEPHLLEIYIHDVN
jgi:hypothetical protein